MYNVKLPGIYERLKHGQRWWSEKDFAKLKEWAHMNSIEYNLVYLNLSFGNEPYNTKIVASIDFKDADDATAFKLKFG